MEFFKEFEGCFTKDNNSLNISFIDMDDAYLIDEKFATIINADPDDLSKIRIEEFDPDATWDASEGEAETIVLEFEEILNDQDEKILMDCGRIQENLSEFLDFKKSQKPKPYSCFVCNFDTNNRYYIQQHYQTAKHKNKVLKSQHIKVFDGVFNCDDCGKIFGKKKHLNDHIRDIHTALKCDKCNRRFRTEKEFNLHKMRHSKSSGFACSYCPKIFTNNPNLRRHERTHTEIKKFVCSICDKNFGQKTNLLRHIKIHKEL